MKFNSLKKALIFLSCSILFILINPPQSRAEQPVSDLSKQIFSTDVLKTLEGFRGEEGVTPVIDSTAVSKDSASFDIRVALSERFKAFLSLGDTAVKDLAGRDVGQSYNAIVGFQILLR